MAILQEVAPTTCSYLSNPNIVTVVPPVIRDHCDDNVVN
jgi:hypothetical protein